MNSSVDWVDSQERGRIARPFRAWFTGYDREKGLQQGTYNLHDRRGQHQKNYYDRQPYTSV